MAGLPQARHPTALTIALTAKASLVEEGGRKES